MLRILLAFAALLASTATLGAADAAAPITGAPAADNPAKAAAETPPDGQPPSSGPLTPEDAAKQTAAEKEPAAESKPATEQPPAESPAAAKPPAAPPPKGSQVAVDKVNCVLCHTDSGLWDEKDEKSWRLYVPREKLDKDVHFLKGVNCQDCHGGNYESEQAQGAHAKEDGFRSDPAAIRKFCAACHKHESVELLKGGAHATAGLRDERDRGTPLGCEKCHGDVSHHTLPAHDKQSPVFLDNQVRTCGSCHEEHQESYTQSVHGQGLYKLGLAVTASCSDCHGAHGIYYATDERSNLHSTHVAQTCGKCHRFIEERLQRSVHAQGHAPGGMAERVAPGGTEKRTPSCTSCHQGHQIAAPQTAEFRQQLPNLCGTCHAELSKQYTMSMHGELTELGYAPAAKCSDCHGAHEILAVDNPASRLSPENRREACQKCHLYATANFLAFDPHADHTSAQRDPLLHAVYVVLMTLLVSTFCAFGLHSFIWLIRGVVDVHRNGRPRGLVPGHTAYVRFVPFYRQAHTLLLLSFLGLALTGLPLRYSDQQWAQTVAFWLGGFGSTSIWHRIFAIFTFGVFIAFVVRLVRIVAAGRRRGKSWKGLVFGPDSPVPNLRDLKDFGRMAAWFVGLGPKPTFERWTYWEKFDLWGAAADIMIIGSTGLVLWFPNLFCALLPGETINVAKVIHSTQALLATGFVFAIHFFSIHFRAERFPADMSVLTGLTSEEELREERPELLARWQREGKLERRRTTVPSRKRLLLLMSGGLLALAGGMALLVAMVIAGLSR